MHELDADKDDEVEGADIPEIPEGEAPKDEIRQISQAEFDKIIQNRLKRQEQQLLKKYADYDDRVKESESFRELQAEKATDSERWEKERAKFLSDLQERDTELSKLQRANLVADLATERGLPKSFWKRVQGDTSEEIAEDMDSIISDLGLNKGEDKKDTGKTTQKRGGSVYAGGGAPEDQDPDTDAVVSNIPRGAQIRVDKSRAYR